MKLNEIQGNPGDKQRVKNLKSAVDEIMDIVDDHMEKIKPSKYIKQIQDRLEKASSPLETFEPHMQVEMLEELLQDIKKIADQNPDSEFEGGRAVNPNDELRISSIIDNVL